MDLAMICSAERLGNAAAIAQFVPGHEMPYVTQLGVCCRHSCRQQDTTAIVEHARRDQL